MRKVLVYDIPVGSQVGLVLYHQTAYTKLPLTVIPSRFDERQRLATSSMPRNPSQVTQSQKCILCGLKESLKVSTNINIKSLIVI